MKILTIFGSPHLNGNTNKVLNMVTKDFDKSDDYKRVNLVNLDINHCLGCNKCNEEGYKCIFNDDMTEIYQLIEEADVVVLATPIHFNSMTSIMKVMIDRCQRFFNMKVNNKYDFKKKIGVIIAVAGDNNDEGFYCLKKISKYFFLSINAKLEKTLLINGTDNTDESDFDLKAIQDMEKYLCSLYKDC